MESKVRVVADAAGNVIVKSLNSPEFGYIRVVQDRVIFDESGFMSKKPTGAIINGLITDLQSMNWVKDQELTGRVVIKHSLEPFNKKSPERDYKVAGDTGITCCVDGKPIYRKTFYSADPNTLDSPVILHDNKEDIVAKQTEMKAAAKGSALKPNTEFSL